MKESAEVNPLRVLVVEDEVALAMVIGSYFEREGYEVSMVHDGISAVEKARIVKPDLIVLDVMLPGCDGFEVCRLARQFTDCYVIMVTAREDEVDKVLGLSMGADDYLVKPFSPRELIARAKAMLRRPRLRIPADGNHVIAIGDLQINLESREATVVGMPLDLTRTEFDLLAALAARPRAAFTRAQLIESVWGQGWYGDEHVVDVHIGHIRRKLKEDATEPRFLRTVRGVGYGMGSG